MGVYVFFVLIGFVLCCLQAHPLLPFAYAGIRPDLVLILVVYFSAIAYIDICLGALVVSVLGYVLAMLSGAPFGLYALTFLAIFVFMQALKRVIDLQLLALLALLVALSSLIKEALVFTLFWLFSSTTYSYAAAHNIFLSQLLFTLAVAPFVLLALQKGHGYIAEQNSFNLFKIRSSPGTIQT
jgi:rod shape-determining protein MreD